MNSVLVTGGNRGIGLEICRQLSGLGWKVYLGSRILEAGKAAAASIEGEVIPVEIDVTNVDSIRKAFNEVAEIDVLINNAGLFGERSLRDPDMEEIRNVLNVNLLGVIETTKYFMIRLKKSKDPRIINISSGMGSWTDLDGSYASYRLSKVSLNAFTVMLAAQLKDAVGSLEVADLKASAGKREEKVKEVKKVLSKFDGVF